MNKFVSADAATQINIPDVLRKKIEGHVRVLQEVLGCGCWMCVCTCVWGRELREATRWSLFRELIVKTVKRLLS